MCRNPYVQGMHAYGCGQCMPCRSNRRRIWTHRLMLESLKYSDCAFVTLTYADEWLRMREFRGTSYATLVPTDLQLWLKRLRKVISPSRVRFYGVGEYGDESQRPHYHVALFGYASCLYGVSRYSKARVNCCVRCDCIRDTWGLGNILLGTLEERSAQYIAGYVMKKMTSTDDVRLHGRHPEFARMSLRPGIGGYAVEDIANALVGIPLDGDVPSGLRHGSKVLPLGRYLKRRLRVQLGRGINEPASLSLERSKEMHAVYVDSISDPSRSVKQRLLDVDASVVAGLEARRRIFKKRSSL